MLFRAAADFPSVFSIVLGYPSQTIVFLADLGELEGVEEGVEGIDVVVQMAADPRPEAHWKSFLSSNIIGVRNMF